MPTIDTSYVVWGIDPSSTATGWAIVRFTERSVLGGGPGTGITVHAVPKMIPEYIDSGVIRPGKKLSFNAKLGKIVEELSCLRDDHEDPCVVNLEKQFMTPVARCSGAVIGFFESWGIPCVDVYTPAEVKKHVAGHGNASKQDVARAVEPKLGLPEGRFDDDNESDAVALALCPVKVGVVQTTAPLREVKQA